MNRRQFFNISFLGLISSRSSNAFAVKGTLQLDRNPSIIQAFELDDDEWKMRLEPLAYEILRNDGTESSGSSKHNHEKRDGDFVCAGCNLALFTAAMKYESGTGWPSFFNVIEGRVETKTDFKSFYPRTEYHCIRCGGHQGHVFKDGPKPTGLRYCNNGAALVFIPV